MHRSLALLLVLTGLLTDAAAQEPSAAALLPETTVLYVEAPAPEQLIAAVFDHPIRQKIESLAPWQAATRTAGYRQFLTGRKFFEIQMGMEWREAFETLTAKGIHVAVDSATGGAVLLVHSGSEQALELLAGRILALSFLSGENRQEEGEYRGITAYRFDKVWAVVEGEWLVVTNRDELGKAVLDRLLDGEVDASLLNSEVWKTARQDRDATSAWGFVDLDALRRLGVGRKAFAGKSDNPGVEILIGGILDLLQETPLLTGTLQASHEQLAVQLELPSKAEWISEERTFYFGDGLSGQGPDVPEVKDSLFTLSAYRDASEMWLRAGDLFNEDINDGLAEADANLTTFFSGKDFGEEILGALTPQIGFVASRQDFQDILPVPTIKLPQFALVLNLREPEKMTRELRRTFQSMVGFFNVIGAMEGRPQLEMDIDKLENGAELITSVYIPEEGEEDSEYAPILFNFSPSVGFRGDQFVVSSTSRLARELVLQPRKRDGTGRNTAVKLDAETLKTVLADNRDQLVSQNMLEEGNNKDEAEVAIDLLLEVVGYFDSVTLDLQQQQDALQLQFQVQVRQE
ncbi:MAG: hypothetical protein NXI04_27685 [Planctomycetaceae bacterium]|nr:hypothetical protein [Planctomycetaceae bacterium]